MPAETTPPHVLADTPAHLGLGARAVPVDGFAWTAEALADYERRFSADGDEGRLVTWFDQDADWSTWECHPHGDEVVLVVSGRATLVQRLEDGSQRRIDLEAGQYAVNPPGVWHTADVHVPGAIVTITAGRGTQHEAR